MAASDPDILVVGAGPGRLSPGTPGNRRGGEPFRTSGCEGYDGQVACNRPFANSRPGNEIRNYPFSPEEEDIRLIRQQLKSAVNFEYAPG